MSQQQLSYEITKLSHNVTWELAKDEWKLHTVYVAHNPETCTCGHFPIKEICTLRNKINGFYINVGNCCVKKFMGLPSDLIFQAVKRVTSDNSKSLNTEALQYAKDKGWINDWEMWFYLNTMTKRKLTEKQKAKKLQVNQLVLQRMQYKPTPVVRKEAPIFSVVIPF